MTPFKRAQIALIGGLVIIFIIDYLYELSIEFYLIPVLLFLTFVVAGSSILSLNFFTKSYTYPQIPGNEVAITFDDGPDKCTQKVLEVLKAHNVKATFFCIGEKIEKNPDLFKQIIDDGHLVGNHSYSHSNTFPVFRKSKIVAEISKTNGLIEQYSGEANDLFRPPFGVMNPTIAKAAKETEQKVIGWNLRSFDTSMSKEKVIRKIKRKLKPGTVLLLHDDREGTAEILDTILQYAKSGNYNFVDVRQIFKL